MASITIRNLDEDIKERLRERAAQMNRSMEEEARVALGEYVARVPDVESLSHIVRATYGPQYGVDFDVQSCEPDREPPSSD